MSNFLAELIGTAILVLFGDGVVAGVTLKHSKSAKGGWIVVTAAWGLGVTLAIYGVGSFSGAHINPAVTFAMALSGDLPWSQVPAYMSGQFLGGIIGACLVWLHYLPHWKLTDDPSAKLGVFATIPAVRSKWSNLFSEFLGTFILVTGLLFIGANEFSQGLNPIVVGLLILAIGLSMGCTTGYAINPARDLGPRIAHALLPIHGKGKSDWGYSWIPVFGPLLGGGFGAIFYSLINKGDLKPIFWIFLVIIVLIVVLAIRSDTKTVK
jgi:glycerol uptake facilitator protein